MRVRVFPKTLRVEIENETRVFPESLIFETEMRVSQKSDIDAHNKAILGHKAEEGRKEDQRFA